MNALIRSSGKLLTYTRHEGAKSGNDVSGIWLRTTAIETGLSGRSCSCQAMTPSPQSIQGGSRKNKCSNLSSCPISSCQCLSLSIPNISQWASQLPQRIEEGREEQKWMSGGGEPVEKQHNIHLLVCLSVYPSIRPSIHLFIEKSCSVLCFVTTFIFTMYHENLFVWFIIYTFLIF